MYDCPQNEEHELFYSLHYFNLVSIILILMTGIPLKQNSTIFDDYMSIQEIV